MNAHTRSRATAPRPIHGKKRSKHFFGLPSSWAACVKAEAPEQRLQTRRLVTMLVPLFLGSITSSAQAVESALPQVDVSATASCMATEVDGQRAPPSFECLTSKLSPQPADEKAQRQARSPLGSEAIIQRPSNQLGLFNRAATGHRMGNQFGISAFPQRPPEAQVSPRSIPVVPR